MINLEGKIIDFKKVYLIKYLSLLSDYGIYSIIIEFFFKLFQKSHSIC